MFAVLFSCWRLSARLFLFVSLVVNVLLRYFSELELERVSIGGIVAEEGAQLMVLHK